MRGLCVVYMYIKYNEICIVHVYRESYSVYAHSATQDIGKVPVRGNVIGRRMSLQIHRSTTDHHSYIIPFYFSFMINSHLMIMKIVVLFSFFVLYPTILFLTRYHSQHPNNAYVHNLIRLCD